MNGGLAVLCACECVCHLTEMIVTYCNGLLTLINLIED